MRRRFDRRPVCCALCGRAVFEGPYAPPTERLVLLRPVKRLKRKAMVTCGGCLVGALRALGIVPEVK